MSRRRKPSPRPSLAALEVRARAAIEARRAHEAAVEARARAVSARARLSDALGRDLERRAARVRRERAAAEMRERLRPDRERFARRALADILLGVTDIAADIEEDAWLTA